MGFNLTLILTVFTLVSGGVLLLNRFLWGELPNAEGRSGPRRHLVDYSRSFFPMLLFVLLVRSFLFEPFRIPSGSMMPTLLKGDFIFVEKFAYGLRLPVMETKIVDTGAPERGDVIVFRLPSNPRINYIKRVVGLPGDTLVYDQHRLVINGELVKLNDSEHPYEPRYTEAMGERGHEIMITNPGRSGGSGTYVVPPGHYFMMGDNRDNSRDSRFIGAIPESHLVGKAVRIWMHFEFGKWPRWERIGDRID